MSDINYNDAFPAGGYAWLDENKKLLVEQIPNASEEIIGGVVFSDQLQMEDINNNNTVMTPQRTKQSISQEFTNILSNQEWINQLKIVLGI